MNYKNNLLTKKKYKIVNQKGGIEIGFWTYWTFCVRYTDYFPYRFSENYILYRIPPAPFDITIGKYYWPGGVGGNHYSISNVNGENVNLEMNEEKFIDYLLEPNNKGNLGFGDEFNKFWCILYHIAFFEECIPSEFQQLYSKLFEHTFFKIKLKNSLKFCKDTVKGIKDLKEKNPDRKLLLHQEELYKKLIMPESEINTVIQEMEKYATKFTKPYSPNPCSADKIYDSCAVQEKKLEVQRSEIFREHRKKLSERLADRGVDLKRHQKLPSNN